MDRMLRAEDIVLTASLMLLALVAVLLLANLIGAINVFG